MKKIITLLCFFIGVQAAASQTLDIDSVYRKVEKNKAIRLAKTKRTIEKLEGEISGSQVDGTIK
jgi:hypothetical protein